MSAAFECEFEETFSDYRERIVLAPAGGIICSESAIRIPEGQPYAECQGKYEGEWDSYPQTLEVWRFLRNLKVTEGSCFLFEGVSEELSNYTWDSRQRIVYARWARLCKRVRERYQSGGGPKLHPWERLALESGEWFDWIQFPQGGYLWKLNSDGTKREVVPPKTPAGEPWSPSGGEEALSE